MAEEPKEFTVSFFCEKCGAPHHASFLPHHTQDKVHCGCGVVYTVPRPTWEPDKKAKE